MKIEIAVPGRMSQSGSSLLRLIQNNDMPLLDLLVRESAQNSLDACKPGTDHVDLHYRYGLFETAKLVKHLDGVSDALKKKHPEVHSSYIAVRDSNTKGLTGPLHFDDVTGTDYGNCLKLIYEISKPQENAGAGGSWGLGKTVYFRVGIGMVVYYSRIQDEDGRFASRLAVSMVEDENSDNAIIPSLPGKARRGIAWWGEGIGENTTQPLQDETEIEKIISIFGISPYSGDETGTTIIIPFVDSERLLASNAKDYENSTGKTIKPYWTSDITDYIQTAVQRWYAPRLNNPQYKYGPYLKAYVEGISSANECTCESSPLALLEQTLYNLASENSSDGIVEWNGAEIHLKTVQHKNLLEKSSSGRLAYVRIPKEYFMEGPPDNKPNPYVYANCERLNSNVNPPILTFCRKPGMIVSYETTGNWVDGIAPSTLDAYIVGFFVLASPVKFKSTVATDLTIEEYTRNSELADHTSWSDMMIPGSKISNPRLISKIRASVVREISKAYADTPAPVEHRTNMGLGKLFGDLLLPPLNFGKQPSIPGRTGGGGQIEAKRPEAILRINSKNVVYGADGTVQFPFRLDVTKNYGLREYRICMEIAVDSHSIKVTEWEDLTAKTAPFSITAVSISLISRNKKVHMCSEVLSDKRGTAEIDGGFLISGIVTSSGSWYGLSISSESKEGYSIGGKLSLVASDKRAKAIFHLDVDDQDRGE